MRSKRSLCTLLCLAGCVFAAAGLQAQIVEYIVIDHPSISPNGDGVQDSSAVVIALQETALRLVVTLEDTVSAMVVDTLLDITDPAAQEYETAWKGTDSLGMLMPDGGYRISFIITGETNSEEYSRTVIVDTTRPVITLDRIEPGVYTPDIGGTSEEVLIYFYLVDLGEPDSVDITVVNPQGVEIEVPLGPLADGLNTASWVGDESSPDGLYGLSLHAYDEAGNESGDTGFINVDTEGPVLAFIDPLPEQVNRVPLVQEGYCTDRNGIEEPLLVWNGSDPFAPHGTSWRGDTLFWSFDLRDSVLVGGAYVERTCTLQVLCSDVLGHDADERMTFTVDLTPPDPPILRTPLYPAHVPEYEVIGSSPFGDSVMVYRVAGSDTATYKKNLVVELFGVTVDLLLGENEIWAKVADLAGNWSEPSNRITVVFDDAAGFFYPEAFRGPDNFEILTNTEALGVEIKIYTLGGEEVATLGERGPATRFDIEWSLQNDDGEEVRNGPYLVVITVEYASGKTVDKNFIAVVR